MTLGEHPRGQARRMCGAAGFAARGDGSGRALSELLDLLGPAAHRPLGAGPPSRSFVCDDHSPAEFSLAFSAGSPVSLRLLVEPGCSASTLEENGRLRRRALEALAARRDFSTEPVRRVEDLFFPSAMHGLFALWCAMELRQDRPAGLKVYVNPQGPRARAVRAGHAGGTEPVRIRRGLARPPGTGHAPRPGQGRAPVLRTRSGQLAHATGDGLRRPPRHHRRAGAHGVAPAARGTGGAGRRVLPRGRGRSRTLRPPAAGVLPVLHRAAPGAPDRLHRARTGPRLRTGRRGRPGPGHGRTAAPRHGSRCPRLRVGGDDVPSSARRGGTD
ncbi:hypothetical protein K4G64_26750 [Streptomyces sp. WAC04114]|nr:hypothetical protein [Streptomyces sp. WAC04114]